METFIVYLDDKQYALQQIVPMLPAKGSKNGAANWMEKAAHSQELLPGTELLQPSLV